MPATPAARRNSRRSPLRAAKRRLMLESLEGRDLLAGLTISISDATLSETAAASVFVPQNSGGLTAPKDLTLGPDGNLYVASAQTNSVLRYNGTTGQFLGTFVSSGSGGLQGVFGVAFGSDGNLYVASGTDEVLRYQGPGGASPGAFINAFVPSGFQGIDAPTSLVFGADGDLYVTSRLTNSIMRFAGPGSPIPGSPLPAAGQSGADFVAAGSGGLTSPFDLAFGTDGNLYVNSIGNVAAVKRFNGSTGAFIDTIVTQGQGGLVAPRGMAFDQDGRLYVADQGSGAIHRYDLQGNSLSDLIPSGASGLATPIGMAIDSQGSLLVSNGGYSAIAKIDRGVTVMLSNPSATPITVDYATASGTASTADYLSQSGTVTFLPGQTTRTILLATNDDIALEGNETFSVSLSNPIGDAAISTGVATVTIADDDSARQITIGDASATEGSHTAHFRGALVNGLPGYNFNGPYFGPDGYLYASPGPAPTQSPINRYDAMTGAFVDEFIPAGHVNGVRDMQWRDGYLYVGSEYTDEVLRFNASTGAFVDAFVAAGSIDGPSGMSFGPDWNGDGIPELYVAGRNSANVMRFDGATGAPLGAYITTGSGGLSLPEGITFDSTNTYLYVSNSGSNQVLRYNALTGAYVGVAASANISTIHDVKFGPDGLLYVASGGNNRILRFNAAGAYVDDYVPAGSGGLSNPTKLRFGPDGDLYVTAVGNRPLGSSDILRFGTESEILFPVTLSSPSSLPVTVSFSSADGSATAGSDYSSISGTVTFPPGVTTKIISVSLSDDTTYEGNETLAVNLSNAVGGIVSDSQAIGTIVDNDLPPAKFYVVDDGSANKTYEYGANGAAIENYAVNSGNTAPRGAASTAAGNTVWVVDANKHVYVYDTSGGLLGSWAAGSLPVNADVQGISTNGTDVWIVDAKGDKVYKYAGAASLLSGSQNAASSFSLNSGNSSPSDLVTDGTSIWVLNNSSTDKVFKYTVGGSLLGSWTISGGGGSPTGITIDPTNVSNIWIVDNATDRVYQFDAAASRTSGSQAPSTFFSLAAGNTNPQGIADPPAGAGSTSAYDSALLAVIGDLDDVLGTGKKQR